MFSVNDSEVLNVGMEQAFLCFINPIDVTVQTVVDDQLCLSSFR